MKKEPYIITENLSVQDICDLIKRAYQEGYDDGYTDGMATTPHIVNVPATEPLKIYPTPNDPYWKDPNWYKTTPAWNPPPNITCSKSNENAGETIITSGTKIASETKSSSSGQGIDQSKQEN